MVITTVVKVYANGHYVAMGHSHLPLESLSEAIEASEEYGPPIAEWILAHEVDDP